MRRVILAMGGGGFSAGSGGSGDPVLDEFVLSLAPAERPRICLLPTAGGDGEDQIRRFYEAYGELDCEPNHLSLFRLGSRPVDPAEYLLSQDIIYAGGGSMLNLLAIWRAHGLDRILRTAWERGIVLSGISAGAMCWFGAGVTKSHGRPAIVEGLGFLPGSASVHWRSEPERRPFYLDAVASGALPAGYGLDDGVGIVWEGTRLIGAVSAREGGEAWQIVPDGHGGAARTALGPRRLAEAPPPRVSLAIEELREQRRHRAAAR